MNMWTSRDRRRFLPFVVTLVLAWTLAACGGATQPAANQATSPAATNPTTAPAATSDAPTEPAATTDAATAAPTEPAATSAASGEKLKVVATTSLVGDAVRRVAGDAVDLTVMLPIGTDTHSYEPTPQDVVAVAEADVVFMNGFGLEEFMERLIENAGGEPNVVSVSEGITSIAFEGEHDEHSEGEHDEHAEGTAEAEGEHAEGEHDEHAEGTAEAEGEHAEEHAHADGDPHVWFDPLNVATWARNIEQTLSELDAANAATYKANADVYEAELQSLDESIKSQFEQILEANRKLVTDHDTFGYLAERYGFELVGAVIPSFSSVAEPSPQELAELQEAVQQYNVPAIFISNEVSSSVTQRVAEDTGAELVFVYVESLSEEGGPADDYISFMQYNTSAIAEALK
jgi:ABC-type Zn uptake system ZnuABC Zn-binding protein ZnuA